MSRSIVTSTFDYTRLARRLRSRHARRPGRMLTALRELSDRHDRAASRRPTFTTSSAQPINTQHFIRQIPDHLDGPVLRYSSRLALLGEAARLGIGRFEANLLIAEAQHRSRAVCSPRPRRRQPLIAVCSVFVLVQLTLLSAGWWIFQS